jgi:hypothetical protein
MEGGVKLVTLASDPKGLLANPAYHFSECHDECSPSEFGVSCDAGSANLADAASPTSNLPYGCHRIGGDGPHVTVYCCPCGS